MQDAEESDDFLYASLLFHEINAENLSDESTEQLKKKLMKIVQRLMNLL